MNMYKNKCFVIKNVVQNDAPRWREFYEGQEYTGVGRPGSTRMREPTPYPLPYIFTFYK